MRVGFSRMSRTRIKLMRSIVKENTIYTQDDIVTHMFLAVGGIFDSDVAHNFLIYVKSISISISIWYEITQMSNFLGRLK